MKVTAFVPIKTNNERCPGKNTRNLAAGKPLLSFILETLCKVNEIDEIYIYCSDENIKEYASGRVKFLKRDPYYDLQSTPFNDVLKSFAELVDSDIYVLTHATAPFLSVDTFRQGINAVRSDEYDSAFSVLKQQEFVWKNKKPDNYQLENIPRTQDLEPFYIETCGMYIYTKDLIVSKRRRIGEHPFLVEVSKMESVDVNTEEDFKFAKFLAAGILNEK